MVFSTYSFVLIFLPIVLIVYFGMARFVPRRVQQVFLILASLVFYGALFFNGFGNLSYIWLILSSVIVNYSISLGVQNAKNGTGRKILFTAGVVFNVCLIGYYKYFNFFIENINLVFGTEYLIKYIALPLGISFFTFQQIAYLIGVWKRQERVPQFFDYTLFIVFFPQLVAGPIVFLNDVIDQYRDEKNRFFNVANFSPGIFLFAIGLFKKAVIADTFSDFVLNGYFQVENLAFGQAWMTSLFYTFQIYFDFSGYSDMAIGLARMMNIDLPVNFYSPYKSKSITEFWQRWHITLGRSLAVLIYFPLGGNRKGKVRTCINLLMVFLVSGIWHGAAWAFVIWGLAHGVVRVFEKIFERQIVKVPSLIRIFFTFMFVNAAWVLFRLQDTERALVVLKKMFVPDSFSFENIGILAYNANITYPDILATIYICVAMALAFVMVFVFRKNSIDLYNNFQPKVKWAIVAALLLAISLVHFSRVGAFIYFNF
ncbi:MBOAT family protein [Dysgonomonas sp. 511]|uniref:MBOAT family O-acyltransferase n=1 Tax=Dysgonomonas sp. 511 TaxID=2302930 RepID=UPI0013D3574B|nr:MBOAT family O-acyltransferase [Dysgonomonas sp. 511]NDV79333.1 MBOAT family protein [Dysgonomonas sp. 511]